MAFTEANTLENIPIKSSAFLGNSLGIINKGFATLQNDIKTITVDKIPDPTQLTTIDLVPTPYFPQPGNVLTFDMNTASWIPSAIPSPGPSFVRSWVSFRAACGLLGYDAGVVGTGTKVLSYYNVDRIESPARGEFNIFFENSLALDVTSYAVFATGIIGGLGTSTASNIDCCFTDRFSYKIKWNKGSLKYGSTINAFVFAKGNI